MIFGDQKANDEANLRTFAIFENSIVQRGTGGQGDAEELLRVFAEFYAKFVVCILCESLTSRDSHRRTHIEGLVFRASHSETHIGSIMSSGVAVGMRIGVRPSGAENTLTAKTVVNIADHYYPLTTTHWLLDLTTRTRSTRTF